MKKFIMLFSIIVAGLLMINSSSLNAESNEKTIAFVDVNVIPMKTQAIFPNYTVIVRNGIISAVGPSKSTSVPKEARIINGKGLYLMPGLSDMHVHLGTGDSEAATPGQLLLYLANGITTVLDCGDFDGLSPEWKAAVIEGRIDGPTIYCSKFARGIQDGGPDNLVVTESQAADYVREAKEDGYDFIKVYNWTDANAFEAIMKETKKQSMAVIGHIPQLVTPDRVLESGMAMVAHIGSGGFFKDYYNPWVQDGAFPSFASKVKKSGIYVDTTLVIDEALTKVWGNNEKGFNNIMHQEGIRYAHPDLINSWNNYMNSMKQYNWQESAPGDRDETFKSIKHLTSQLNRAGVKLLSGTDSSQILLMPGFSLHREFELLKDCGLKPYEILKTSTSNPGEFIRKFVKNSEAFGTVEVGKRADLLLLKSNPLVDIKNVKKRVGVMARGRWYTESDLQNRLKKLIAVN